MNGILLNQGGAGAVESVNGHTGEVNLTTKDLYDKFIVNDNIGLRFYGGDGVQDFSVNLDGIHYSSKNIETGELTINSNGLTITNEYPDHSVDVILKDQRYVDGRQTDLGTYYETHKLSEKVDKKALERLQYYGDANIVPTDESYFEIRNGHIGLKREYQESDVLTEIVIPYKIGNEIITGVNSGAFYRCFGLTNIMIPNSVTSIGEAAFQECSSLTNIIIPDSVTSISALAFTECSSLTNVTIPSGITTINYDTFSGCSNLTNITIPNSVASIGSFAFKECSSLTNIIIPDSVLYIEEDAFQDRSDTLTFICSQKSYADTYAKDKGIRVVYNTVEPVIFKLQKDSDGTITDMSDYDMQEEGIFEDICYKIKNYSPIWFILNNYLIYFPVAIDMAEYGQFTIVIMTTLGTIERYCYSKDMGWWQDM